MLVKPRLRAFQIAVLAALLVGVVPTSTPAAAQSTTVLLQGRVTDAVTGSGIEGALITLTSTDVSIPGPPPIRTNTSGVYLLNELVAGATYNYSVGAESYETAVDVGCDGLCTDPGPIALPPSPMQLAVFRASFVLLPSGPPI
jgi:hypothetical protein